MSKIKYATYLLPLRYSETTVAPYAAILTIDTVMAELLLRYSKLFAKIMKAEQSLSQLQFFIDESVRPAVHEWGGLCMIYHTPDIPYRLVNHSYRLLEMGEMTEDPQLVTDLDVHYAMLNFTDDGIGFEFGTDHGWFDSPRYTLDELLTGSASDAAEMADAPKFFSKLAALEDQHG